MNEMRGIESSDALKLWLDGLLGGTARSGPPIFMLAGAQGSGKTTLAAKLRNHADARLLCLSLDDFYLGRAQREALAADVDPLFITRGPPGTHDLELLSDVIDRAMSARVISTPVFDKLRDDRLPSSHWRRYYGPFDAVLLEGWCLGVEKDLSSLDDDPMNEIEQQDASKNWRRYQEECLGGDYAKLFERAWGLTYLLPPDFNRVYAWRLQQELDNRNVAGLNANDERALASFVAHFERLTRRLHAGKRLPGMAFHLDENRRLIRAS